jgi:fatty acid-binding protein DegV
MPPPSLEQALLSQSVLVSAMIDYLVEKVGQSHLAGSDAEDVLRLMQHHCNALQIAIFCDENRHY